MTSFSYHLVNTESQTSSMLLISEKAIACHCENSKSTPESTGTDSAANTPH